MWQVEDGALGLWAVRRAVALLAWSRVMCQVLAGLTARGWRSSAVDVFVRPPGRARLMARL